MTTFKIPYNLGDKVVAFSAGVLCVGSCIGLYFSAIQTLQCALNYSPLQVPYALGTFALFQVAYFTYNVFDYMIHPYTADDL